MSNTTKYDLYYKTYYALRYFWDKGTQNWQDELDKIYTPGTATHTKTAKSIANFIKKNPSIIHQDVLPRLVVGSPQTVLAEGHPTFLPSEIKAAIKQLKYHKKIMQVGGGAGKGLMIFNNVVLEENEIFVESINPADPKALGEAMKEQLDDKLEDIILLKKEIAKRDKQLKERDAKIQTLNAQVEATHMESWH